MEKINDSSNVDQIGYDATTELLTIIFKDGSRYDAVDTPVAIHTALMASPSKGAFIHRYLRNQLVRVTLPAPTAAQELVSLQSHEPDACCGHGISRAMRSGTLDGASYWECPKCGVRWEPRMAGTVRHWEPKPYFLVLRARP